MASVDGSTINFKLRGGAPFGTLDVTGSTASFALSESGFASQISSTTPDTGSVTLTVSNSSGTVFSKSTNYGEGATPSSIAADLGGSSSNVNVSAVDDTLVIQATGTGANTDYIYAVTSTWNSIFSQPSFSGSPATGSLEGGANAGSGTRQLVYRYGASYDFLGNVTSFSDNSYNGPIMGAWSMTSSPGNGFCTTSSSGYDCLNRLVAATATSGPYGGLEVTWSYDSFGNRTSENITGSPAPGTTVPIPGSSTTSYNANNQVSHASPMPNDGPLGYDSAGDVTQDNQNQYLYDDEGRICAVRNFLGGMTGYLYDAEGNRIAKGTIQNMTTCDPSVNGFQLTNSYALDAAGNQMSEYVTDADGNLYWQHTNVWTGGKLLATYETAAAGPPAYGATLHFYLDDPLGTRRVQTDYAGVIEQTCSSLPFGDGESCTPTPTEHLFTGKERDAESGNDYFGARYYASTMGRFLSPDWSAKVAPVPYAKLDNPQTLNLYAYVGNNPLTRRDLDGHTDVATDCKGKTPCHETVVQNVQIWRKDKNNNPYLQSTLKVTTNFTLTTDAKGNVSATASSTVENAGGHSYSADELKTMGTNIGTMQQAAVFRGFGQNTTQMVSGIGAAETSFGGDKPFKGAPDFMNPAINPMQLTGRGGANLDLNHNVEGGMGVLDWAQRTTGNASVGPEDYYFYSDRGENSMANFLNTYDSLTEKVQ